MFFPSSIARGFALLAFCVPVCLMILATPARATGTIECTGADGANATAFLSIGRVPVLAVLNASFEAEGAVWATAQLNIPGATEILFGQGFQESDELRADFTDNNVSEIIIKLRLFRAYDDKADAEAGILHIVGVGAYPVTCESG